MNKRLCLLILCGLGFARGGAFAGDPSPQITSNGVTFSYYDPNAFSVSLTGEFNQWSINSHLMERSKQGVWTITVPLKPGKYQYQFNVNGMYWKPDPSNPNKVTDNYGGIKSIVEVPDTSVHVAALSPVFGGPRETRFTFREPAAREVAIGGFFNNWSHTANVMTNDGNGNWTGVIALKPGSHPYKFWVDGKWRTDPTNLMTVPDGYGASNSVVNVSQ